MAYIGRDIEYGVLEKETLTADSSTVAFDLAYSANANGLIVSVGGIVQEPNVAYTVVGNTLTFSTAPVTGDTVYVVYLGEELMVSIVKPLDYIDYQVGTGDGSDTTPIATLNHSVSLAQDIMVTLNGVRQVPGTDYSVSGTTLTFVTAPAAGVAILVYFLMLERAEGEILDNSITDAKIVGMSGSKLTGTVANNSVTNSNIVSMDASKLTGSLPSAFQPALYPQYQDLSTIALQWASVNNKVSMNLTDDFIDHFQDSTGVAPYNGVAEIPAVAGHLADHSTTGHTITKYGTVSTSTSIKKFGASSIYLGGGNYLTAPPSSDWVFSGDFTIETWINKTVNNGGDNAVMMTYGTDQDWGQNGWIFRLNGSDQISFQQNNGSGGAGFTLNASTALSIDTWHHVAIVKSGTSYKLYLNGTEDGSTTGSNSIQDLGHRLTIGADYIDTASTRLKPSYMDDIRISNNARYTGNFSVPTAAFTNDSNTLLLMNGNEIAAVPAVPNTGSVNALVSSGEYVTSASEFDTATNIAPSSKDWDYTFASNHWIAAGNSLGDHTVGGYVDGQGNSGLSSLTTLDGDFVIKWTSDNDEGVTFGVASITDDGSRSQSDGIGMHSSGIESYYYREAGGNINKFWIGNSVESGNAYIFDDGSEIVMRRVSGTITIEDDGVVVHTFSTTNSNPVRFFIANNQTSKVDISDLTIEDTEKVQRDGMFDSTSGLDASNIGAGASRKYRGTFFKATRTGKVTGLKVYVHNVNTAGTFHAELWTHNGTSPGSQIGSNSDSVDFDSTGAKNFTFTDPTVIKGQTYWMVLVDDGSTGAVEMRDYLNAHPQDMGGGRVNDAATSLTDNGGAAILRIGVTVDTSAGEPTPDHNTLLLVQSDTINGSQTFVDSSQNAKTITAIGDAMHSTTQYKFGGSSMYCDGTGDLISVGDSDDFAFAGDYTVEFWSYFVGTPPNGAHCWGQGGNVAGNYAFFCRSEGGGTFIFGTSNGSSQRLINPGIDLSDAWHHIAMVKSGTSQKLYIDGTQRGSVLTHSEPVQNVSAPWEFGGNSNQSSYIEAYFDEIRFSKVARWDAEFTPPTAPYRTSTKSTTAATGTLISTTSTADSTVSKATGVMLYKDGEGTNTIGTDLKAYFSADDGSNWTEASSYGTPITFGGTTKALPLGETTMSNTGTAVKLKAEWANQVATVPATGTTKIISPVGNANFSSSQVKIGASSMYFDGTGDQLQIPHTNELAAPSGDFTMEFWFNPTTRHQAGVMSVGNTTTGGELSWCFLMLSSGYISFYTHLGAYVAVPSPADSITAGAWNHVAAVRSGNIYTCYMNGIGGTPVTNSNAFSNYNTPLRIGNESNGIEDYNGYIDEVRISNTARYTANFTPSTTAFTSDANTKLLIHSDTTDDGSMLDSSSNGHTIINATESGSGEATHSTTQSKIGSTSINFPADGTNLEIGVSDDFNWVGDFTIEAWFWRDPSDSGNSRLFNSSTNPASGNQETISIDYDGTNIRLFVSTDGSSRDIFSQSIGGSLLTNSTWHHIAFVRSGNDYNLYQNGSSIWNGSSSSTIHPTNGMAIGGYYNTTSGSATWKGYIDEIRISKTARYTSAFTPSTTVFTSDANTVLLIHSDDASTTFTDSSSNTHAITVVGDAKHQPPVKKIGTSSLYFRKTSANINNANYIAIEDNATWDYGTGDFTWEMWVNVTAIDRQMKIFGSEGWSDGGAYDWIFDINPNRSLRVSLYNGSTSQDLNTTATIPVSTWTHLAVSRSSGTMKIFMDGVERASATRAESLANLGTPYLGWKPENNQDGFAGYMDEVRLSDVARYTANFTPSTTAFTADANTQLLIHGDSTNPQTQVGQAVGTAFGNMDYQTSNLAAAFDGVTNTNGAANIAANATGGGGGDGNAYIGKDWGTSYVTGDRSSDITVTTNMTTTRPITNIVNGAKSGGNDGFYFTGASGNGQTVDSSKYIRFQLATAKTFIGCRIYNDENDDSAGHGFWKWQGSNDATTWTDLGGSFELKNTLISSVPGYADFNGGLPSNTTEYTYYQMVGVSGLADGNSNWLEWEFGEATGITGKTISGVKIYGQNNEGYCGGGGTSTIKLMGSNTLPSSATDGTELGAFADIPDQNNTNTQSKMSGFTTTTPYRYHWLWNSFTGGDQAFFTEVEFFEGDSITDSSYAPEVIGKVAQLHGWAVNY